MVTKNSQFRKVRFTTFQNAVLSGVFVVVFGALIGFFFFQNISMDHRRAQLENQLQTLQAQANELSTQKNELEKSIEESQTQDSQEKALREQGLYKKPGEEVVTVLPPEITYETLPTAPEKQATWWNPFSW